MAIPVNVNTEKLQSLLDASISKKRRLTEQVKAEIVAGVNSGLSLHDICRAINSEVETDDPRYIKPGLVKNYLRRLMDKVS